MLEGDVAKIAVGHVGGRGRILGTLEPCRLRELGCPLPTTRLGAKRVKRARERRLQLRMLRRSIQGAQLYPSKERSEEERVELARAIRRKQVAAEPRDAHAVPFGEEFRDRQHEAQLGKPRHLGFALWWREDVVAGETCQCWHTQRRKQRRDDGGWGGNGPPSPSRARDRECTRASCANLRESRLRRGRRARGAPRGASPQWWPSRHGAASTSASARVHPVRLADAHCTRARADPSRAGPLRANRTFRLGTTHRRWLVCRKVQVLSLAELQFPNALNPALRQPDHSALRVHRHVAHH